MLGLIESFVTFLAQTRELSALTNKRQPAYCSISRKGRINVTDTLFAAQARGAH